MNILFTGNRDQAQWSVSAAGSKGANLLRLASLGLRVPPAFVLDVDTCRASLDDRGELTSGTRAALQDGIARLERATGRTFGTAAPLLVSVRSSPPISMPGMLSTLLNVGMTTDAAYRLLRTTGNPAFVWDTRRRFVETFAETALGCTGGAFDRLRTQALSTAGVTSLRELDPLALRELAHGAAVLAEQETGGRLPDEAFDQLTAAVRAVIASWDSPRAMTYRALNGIDPHTGTAVVVQAMVFGNWNADSGAGVGFTRNPSTGEPSLYYEFAFESQGEDIVSGRHRVVSDGLPARLPAIDAQLRSTAQALEVEFRDMQDFEFTVEDGVLYFLQTRTGKRTPWAGCRIAADLVRAGVISADEAQSRLRQYDVTALRRNRLQPGTGLLPIASATPAAIGVATGRVLFNRSSVAASSGPVILVTQDLETDDIEALARCEGVLTVRGGRTSHAAVVARQLGKVCLVGCASVRFEPAAHACSIGTRRVAEGDVITLDGDSGAIFAGAVPVVEERPDPTWVALASGSHNPAAATGQ